MSCSAQLPPRLFHQPVTFRLLEVNLFDFLYHEKILRELRLGGLTIQKARELMKDSEELLGR